MVNELDPAGKRRGLLGAVVQVAAPIGLLLANGVFALVTWMVSEDAFFSWGWRVPFLLSAVLVGVGLYIRMNVQESAVFEKAGADDGHAPIKEVLRDYKPQLAIAFFARLGGDIAFYVFTLFLLYYVPTKLGLPRGVALSAVLFGAVAQILCIPLAGWLSDRWGRRPTLMVGGLGGAVWAFAFAHMVQGGDPTSIMVASFVGMILVSFMFSPLASFLPELFATRVRVTGASLGFQFAGVFGGALAPIIATALVARYDSVMPVAVYLAVVCVLIAVAAFFARETAHINLNDAGN
jgi:MFS family permease